MARPVFWPTNDSYVLSVGGFPNAGIPVRVYAAQTGGSPITDLQYVNSAGTPTGAIPNGILISDSNGLLPAFAGPDNGATTLWGNHGLSGERLALTAGPGGGGSGLTAGQIVADSTVISAFGPPVGSDNWLKAWGANVDALIRATTITRDSNEAATGASVVWPDGTTGTYTGTASATTPGAIDSYTVTYAGSPTKTVTQPAMTRNAAGSVTTRPAMTVA